MAPSKRGVSTSSNILVTQVKSAIGTKPVHRGSLRALGLRGIGQQNVLPDTPDIRGIIHRVPHLVTVVPAPDGALPTPARAARRANKSAGEA
jgi:large subunit ribosomal protein L30